MGIKILLSGLTIIEVGRCFGFSSIWGQVGSIVMVVGAVLLFVNK